MDMEHPTRHRRHWTDAEEQFVSDHLHYWGVAAIARHLGRTEKAVRRYQERRGLFCCTGWLLTSGHASRLCGCSPQRLTALARAGRIKARRMPRGHWWLFRQEDLPRGR